MADFIRREFWLHLAKHIEQWAAERNLARAYHEMTTTLTEHAKNGSSTCRMMSGILPRWFVAYPLIRHSRSG